jgi:hypothetical protein
MRSISQPFSSWELEMYAVSSVVWTKAHLAAVPLPRLARWHGGIRRLVELQILPIIDKRFRAQSQDVWDLAPLVLTEIMRSGVQRTIRFNGEESPAQFAYREIRGSLSWVALPKAAEKAMRAFIDSRTDDNPRPQPSAERTLVYA